MSHWANDYVGLPYAEMGCLGLAMTVQRDRFGADLIEATGLDTATATGADRGTLATVRTIAACRARTRHRVVPAEDAPEGALVLMGRREGQAVHVGVLVRAGRELLVLHTEGGVGRSRCESLALLRQLWPATEVVVMPWHG